LHERHGTCPVARIGAAHNGPLTSSAGSSRWIPTPSHLCSRRTELRFTVRGPASAEVSPCCHRPSGGDVTCGVHVGVARPRTAGDALENRLVLTVFRRDMPAVGAPLRRVCSWNEFESTLGLVVEPGNQQAPALATDLAVEASFLRDVCAGAFLSPARRARHGAHIQVLDADGVEAARQLGGGLFHPVATAIGFAGAQPGNGQFRSCPPVGSAPRPGQTPLQSAKSLGFTCTKARNAQQLSAGQRNRYRHAAINTNNAAIIGSGDRFGDGGKSEVPAPSPIPRDSIRLHRAGNVAGPPKSHPTDLRYPYLPVAAAEPLDVAWFESDLPESLMRAGLTPRRAPVGAAEKVTHRLREVSQRLLLHRLRSGCQPVVFGAGRSKLGTLRVIVGRLPAWLPVLLLLDGQIPHKPGVATVFGQCCGLLNAREQPKPAHTNKLGTTTDNPPKGGKWRFLPRLKRGVSTPQIQ